MKYSKEEQMELEHRLVSKNSDISGICFNIAWVETTHMRRLSCLNTE